MKNREISAFVVCALLNEPDPAPMTVDDAAYTIRCWRSDGVDYPNNLTAAVLAYTWNRMISTDQRDSDRNNTQQEVTA